jgi:alkyl sulfatase BDS1-like metallo-beta-lactamase superfamily hydrolase
VHYTTRQHRMFRAVEWRPEDPAYRVNERILTSHSTTACHVVASDAGDVVINAGMGFQGPRHRERFEQALGRRLTVRKLIFTQSHPDVFGGWTTFHDPGVQILAHAQFPQLWAERRMLMPFFQPRNQRVLSGMVADPQIAKQWHQPVQTPEPELVGNFHAFEVGGVEFQLHSMPSGETLDTLVVWLPQQRTVFTGNMLGALHGALPNFYTLRGDRQRSVARFLIDIEKLIGFGAELLIAGHEEPLVGREQITAHLSKIRDAVRFVHDATVNGMNAKKDLHTLMSEIELPSHLQLAPGRTRTEWVVRAVWEEYSGWFLQQSTTELYATPQRAIWGELSELAGGVDVLAKRAQAHVDAGRPLEALHFCDMVLADQPKHRAALQAQLGALEMLLERSGGHAFDEVGWLENRILETQSILRE